MKIGNFSSSTSILAAAQTEGGLKLIYRVHSVHQKYKISMYRLIFAQHTRRASRISRAQSWLAPKKKGTRTHNTRERLPRRQTIHLASPSKGSHDVRRPWRLRYPRLHPGGGENDPQGDAAVPPAVCLYVVGGGWFVRWSEHIQDISCLRRKQNACGVFERGAGAVPTTVRRQQLRMIRTIFKP